MAYQSISRVGTEGCWLEKWLGRALSGCGVLIDVSSSSCSNFILEFPQSATAAERALLTSAVFYVEYHLFEKKGNENSDN